MTGTVANTFTTGPTFDLNAPSVVLSDPPPNTIGVGTNVAPRVEFSKRLNPLSVVSSSNESYNQGSVKLLNSATGAFVPVTVSLSSNRTAATLTPASTLTPNTQYELYIGGSSNYFDVAGNAGVPYTSYFTTGSGADTTAAKVSTISPVNNQTGAPLNAQIVAVMSDAIDPTTVTNNSITVTPSVAARLPERSHSPVTVSPSPSSLAQTLPKPRSITYRSADSTTCRVIQSPCPPVRLQPAPLPMAVRRSLWSPPTRRAGPAAYR
jgi:hypothetical protein